MLTSRYEELFESYDKAKKEKNAYTELCEQFLKRIRPDFAHNIGCNVEDIYSHVEAEDGGFEYEAYFFDNKKLIDGFFYVILGLDLYIDQEKWKNQKEKPDAIYLFRILLKKSGDHFIIKFIDDNLIEQKSYVIQNEKDLNSLYDYLFNRIKDYYDKFLEKMIKGERGTEDLRYIG
jgi:hypothetical protein